MKRRTLWQLVWPVLVGLLIAELVLRLPAHVQWAAAAALLTINAITMIVGIVHGRREMRTFERNVAELSRVIREVESRRRAFFPEGPHAA